MSDHPRFIFVTCQVGAERAVKSEVARRWEGFRFAFSRPGFLTFKIPEGMKLPANFDLESVFARSHSFSVGKSVGESQEELARGVWEVLGEKKVRRIHVVERDAAEAGERGFEPSITPLAVQAGEAIRHFCPDADMLADDPQGIAEAGEFVLDCVIVDEGQWWVGYHRADAVPSRCPGGIMPLQLPADAVSRAWLKMEEGLRWSQLPIEPGARCAELGSAPGGASQALLARGAHVTGVDPAEMHPTVLAHPNFTHVRKRVTQVRRREFRKIRWLTADMNVAPQYTLDAVEGIVTYPEVNVRGLLLTLKLTDWRLAENMEEYFDQIRKWGFNVVSGRQLVYNRREVCVAALKKPFVRKGRKR